MKKYTKISSLLLALLIVALVIGANVWRNRSVVRDVRVDIDYQGADTLVAPSEVRTLILARMPALLSTRIKDVDLAAVEKAAASPFLRHCQATTSIGSTVVLYAQQPQPIVRVMVDGAEYYLTTDSIRLPISHSGNADVPVAGGSITPKTDGERDVWQLALFLHSHPDYGVLFDQIYRNAKGTLFLTPKIGSHVVEVGNTDNLEEKLANLLVFYTQGLPQAGYDTYSQVSIKYRGQVVGTRRDK